MSNIGPSWSSCFVFAVLKQNYILVFVGGLAIGVPGELRGYEKAWRLYGSSKLSWSDLSQPATDMAKNGFKVPKSLENALKDFIVEHKGVNIKEKYPQFW